MTGIVLDAGLAGRLMTSLWKRSCPFVSTRKRCDAANRCEIFEIGPETCGVCLVCIGVRGLDYLSCGSAGPSVGVLRAVKVGAGLDLDLHSGARASGLQ